MIKKIKTLACAFIAILCLAHTAQAQPQKLSVVASFSILGDLVKQVAGDRATVITLVGPGGDAHVYESTPADAKAVAAADVVIVNGLGFEGWLDRLVGSSGYTGTVVVATHGITPRRFAGHGLDPHAWQSIPNAELYVANIRDALDAKDPAGASYYNANAQRYLATLRTLDLWVRGEIAKVPPAKREAITSHDALGYFAEAYGITFIAPLGLSTASDASAGDIARLIDQIRSQHIKAVFLENMTDPRLVRQLAQDGGAVVGGTLYSDALSGPLGDAPSYTAMFHHNVETLVNALNKQ
jgi:zinc/manganese transport system substrate-binding protein